MAWVGKGPQLSSGYFIRKKAKTQGAVGSPWCSMLYKYISWLETKAGDFQLEIKSVSALKKISCSPSSQNSDFLLLFPYIHFEGFSSHDAGRCLLRVFYHKFLLDSCLKMLLRRTFMTYTQEVMKKVNFTSRSQQTPTHKSGPVSLQPHSANMLYFPVGRSRPCLSPL